MSKPNKSELNRRDFLVRSLATAMSGVGLRSILLGVPVSFLTQRVMALGQSTYLIYSCQSEGCPLNANAPGSYVSGVTHPGSLATPATFNLGTQVVTGAAPWATLPQAMRDRMHFIHHSTQTNSHGDAPNVQRMNGALKGASGNGQEMIVSAVAQMTKASLGTITTAPLVVGPIGSYITYNAIPQPMLGPQSIKQLFPAISTTTANLRKIRDNALDSLYKDLRDNNGTTAQKQFLSDHYRSFSDARTLADKFQLTLAGLGAGNYEDQMIAAVALIAAKVTPTVVISLSFGRDNHTASGGEEQDHVNSIAAMNFLWNKMNEFGITDQTTFCLQNVFGRSPKGDAAGGRGHHGAHNVAVMFGPNVKPGVTGELKTGSFAGGGIATAINSITGKEANADIPISDTLASTGKTIMKACGIPEAAIDARISQGKILRSVVA